MLLDKLIAQLAPHECLCCATEGSLLCSACLTMLSPAPSACYRCQRLTESGETCQSCCASSPLFAVRAATVYEGMAKDLVWKLKFDGAQAAAEEMANMLSRSVPRHTDVLLVPVSTATTRVRQRGYDQAKLIARALARQTGAQYLPALRRSGQSHQVGATRAQRIQQLKDAYRVAKPGAIKNQHIVLIDDVLTTGATLEAAAAVLRTAGAKRVSALVFARA